MAGGEGECGDDVAGWLVRERQSLDILPVKKEAKLSASEMPGEVVGSGEEDLRCRSLLTVCQRRLGLSEAEDTRLEKYSFLEDRMSLTTSFCSAKNSLTNFYCSISVFFLLHFN